MPMQRNLYPDNWEQIALAKKVDADWKCEKCECEAHERRAQAHIRKVLLLDMIQRREGTS